MTRRRFDIPRVAHCLGVATRGLCVVEALAYRWRINLCSEVLAENLYEMRSCLGKR